jgi:hypothetical protein
MVPSGAVHARWWTSLERPSQDSTAGTAPVPARGPASHSTQAANHNIRPPQSRGTERRDRPAPYRAPTAGISQVARKTTWNGRSPGVWWRVIGACAAPASVRSNSDALTAPIHAKRQSHVAFPRERTLAVCASCGNPRSPRECRAIASTQHPERAGPWRAKQRFLSQTPERHTTRQPRADHPGSVLRFATSHGSPTLGDRCLCSLMIAHTEQTPEPWPVTAPSQRETCDRPLVRSRRSGRTTGCRALGRRGRLLLAPARC